MRDSNDVFFASLLGAFVLLALHGAAQLTVAPMLERSPAMVELATQVAVVFFG